MTSAEDARTEAPRGGVLEECPSPVGEGSEERALPLPRKFLGIFILEMAYFSGSRGAKFSFKNSIPNALAARLHWV
jgi:hypothetical protein